MYYHNTNESQDRCSCFPAIVLLQSNKTREITIKTETKPSVYSRVYWACLQDEWNGRCKTPQEHSSLRNLQSLNKITPMFSSKPNQITYHVWLFRLSYMTIELYFTSRRERLPDTSTSTVPKMPPIIYKNMCLKWLFTACYM